jgi:hypothetical protein
LLADQFFGLQLSGPQRSSRRHRRRQERHRQVWHQRSASRIVAGQIELHGELERKLAEFPGTEDALIFISGYLTNVSISPAGPPRCGDLRLRRPQQHHTGARLSGARLTYPNGDGMGWTRCWKRNAPASAVAYCCGRRRQYGWPILT